MIPELFLTCALALPFQPSSTKILESQKVEAALRRDDPKAWEFMARLMRGKADGLLKNRELAKEMAQQGCIILLRKLRDPEVVFTNIFSFSFQVVSNLVMTYRDSGFYRHQKGWVDPKNLQAEPDIFEQILKKERMDIAKRALEELKGYSPLAYETLSLVLAGLNTTEIAEKLGVRNDLISLRLLNGRRALKKIIDRYA